MKYAIACLLACAACKTSSSASASAHTETSTVTDTKVEQSGTQTIVTTTTQAPEKTTTRVEEYGPPAPDDLSRAPAASGPTAAGASTESALPRRNVPKHGPLVRRTVTVTETGGETTQTRQEATQQGQAATETHATAKADATAATEHKSAPVGLFAVLAGLWPWLLVAGLVVAGIVAWRIFGPRLKR